MAASQPTRQDSVINSQHKRIAHTHSFGQEHRRSGERRTTIVIILTAITMVVEIVVGLTSGSMALLADGLHMGSHAVALGIAVFAYVYARRRAHDERFSFGTGKVNALAGFDGAILLLGFATYMGVESIGRFIHPVTIIFNQAIWVAVIGLVVNGLSVLILNHNHAHGHDHTHDHAADPGPGHEHGHADHNLRSAYLHVLADALTSVLAIAALLSAKYLGAVWMDPAMGIVGALLVANWSRGLLKNSACVLLDCQAPSEIRDAIVTALEYDSDTTVADLHVWSIGPGIYAAAISVTAGQPQPPEFYKSRLPGHARIVHATIEVHRRQSNSQRVPHQE